MRKTLFLLFVLMFGQNAFSQSKPVRIYIFPRSVDGFVDNPRLTDTVNDIREALAKYKELSWTFTEEKAAITLEVVNSGPVVVGSETESTLHRGILGGLIASTSTNAKTLPNITTVLRVKGSDYSREIAITYQMFWKDLAKNIAFQLDNWIKLNQSKLKP